MSYILAYLFILFDVFLFKNIIPSFGIWCIGYSIVIVALLKKNPLDPRFWLFLGVGILLINGFSGILYVPTYIMPYKTVIYLMATILAFHLGFGKLHVLNGKLNRCKGKILFKPFSVQSNKIHIFWGLIGIVGSSLICLEMFVIFGVSLDDGGERRMQFQELFPLLRFTPIGTILLGGSFLSIFSIFCGGSKPNVILGLLNIITLVLASVAIAGKQGVLFVMLIFAYVYLFHRFYGIVIKVPGYVKIFICASIGLFVMYLAFLTSGRQNVESEGELLTTRGFDKKFVEMSQTYVPAKIQNTFAEFFGYYGNQFPYVAERWEIEGFEEKYGYMRFPRFLGPFTFLERQVIKIFPFYREIYPDDRVETIENQSKGYFGNANWGTIIFLNIKYFGILGGLIAFFFVGKIARLLYNNFIRHPNYITFQLNYINCACMFYFTMFYFTQETAPFIYLLILICMGYYFKKNRVLL